MNLVARFAGWWAAFSMLLASLGGGCPCCGGGAPCARGVVLVGLIGALVPTFLRSKTRPENQEENAHVQPETSA